MSLSRVGRWWRPAGLLSIVLLGISSMVASAWAVDPIPKYLGAASFGAEGSGAGEFTGAKDLAVDPATGNILVADHDNNRVVVFAPDSTLGGVPLTTFGTGAGPVSVAVDSTNGDLYTLEDGAGAVERYTSDGAPTPTYTLDAMYVSPAFPNLLSFDGAMAVDPTTHDLLITDAGQSRVARFSAAGALLSTFDGSSSDGGVFTGLLDIATSSSGQSYVVDSSGDPAQGGPSRVLEFDGSDVFERELGGLDTPRSVTVDGATGHVLVGGASAALAALAPRLYIFNGGSEPASYVDFPDDPSGNGGMAVGLAADSGRGHRVYGLIGRSVIFGTPSIQSFDPAATPGVALAAPSQLTAKSVHLSGVANPGGYPGTAHFEYQLDGASGWVSTPDVNLGSGSVDVPLSADVSGLLPVHTYHVRMVGQSNVGTNTSAELTFSTSTSSPTVVTGAALDRTQDSATVRGSVTPNGVQTSYHFEYGTTDAYGARVPVAHESVVGNGAGAKSVSEGLTGLQASTTYHYRLVATNALGEVAGTGATFTTEAAGTGRVYEMVSPADKNGVDLVTRFGYQVAADGNAAAFETKAALADSPAGPKDPRFLARRTATGWSSISLDAPQLSVNTAVTYTIAALSPDMSQALVSSTKKLADGAADGDSNIYLRNTKTGQYRTVFSNPGTTLAGTIQAPANVNTTVFYGGNADFSHLLLGPVLGMVDPFIPGTPLRSLVDWRDGQLSLTSLDGAGTPLDGSSSLARLSDDGQRVLFVNTPSQVLYLRENGHTTSLSGTSPVNFAGASRDNRYSYFSGVDLTNDRPPTGNQPAFYRYDAVTHETTWLAPAVAAAPLAVSADGQYFYFSSGNNLAPGGGTPGGHGYVWHDGQVKLAWPGSALSASLSPNGRYLAFLSRDNITGYDPTGSGACSGGCSQVYRYDRDSNQLSCASCRPDGAPPTGDATLGADLLISRLSSTTVLDDGRVFFDTPEPLAAADSNTALDVYSFDGSQAGLLSAGRGAGDSSFVNVTPDGNNVFFTTNERLVGQDTDSQTDLYDARVGGGIAAQNPGPASAACSGEECLGALAEPAASPSAATITFAGPGNGAPAAPVSSRVKLSGLKKTVRGSVFTIVVKTAAKGRIVASGSGLKTVKRTATKAASYKLTLRLTKAAKQRLRRHHRVAVKARVTFTPAEATPFTTTVSVTLKG